MSIPFSTDRAALADAVAAALDAGGPAQVTDLPAGLAAEPPLDELWVFDFERSLELFIPEPVRARRSDGPLARACAGAPQPGGFRLVRTVERSDDGLSELIDAVLELASDTAPAAPAVLTDLDRVIASGPANRLPTAADLTADLAMAVKGQPDAIDVVAEAVAGHLRKREPRQPLRMLLVGPSGVGKGETCAALVESLDQIEGSDWNLVRLDGNLLQEAHTVADLVGTTAGHVGYGQGSALVQALATNPRTVVLVDEIDKAHLAILVALMGVLDEGSLQLREPIQGRWRLDCRQAIVVFTSNAGAAEITDRAAAAGLDGHRLETMARRVLMAHGLPEWIVGRLGHIAVYQPLPVPALAEIATLEVARLAREFDLELAWVEPEVVALLLREADASSTGARSLRAVAARLVGPAMADHRTMVDDRETDPGPGDRQIVLVGPTPRCLPYPAWLAAGFPGLGDEAGAPDPTPLAGDRPADG